MSRLVETRRYLHQNPEPSFEENQTSAYICRCLEQLGVPYKRIDTSVIGKIDTGRTGMTLAFRADIDALCLEELNDVPYKSLNPAYMHACGHDAHTAMLLETVKEIKESLSNYSGKFIFIFQHAEEIPPGGAVKLVEEGIITGVDRIIGMHCDPEYPVGQIMTKPGPLMAAVDKFKVTVIGKGGHGAMPHRTVDPIVLTSQIIVNLQTVVSRNTDPLHASLLTIGTINGGESFNVIPEKVTFEGTVRTLDSEVRAMIQSRIRTLLKGMTDAYGAGCDIQWTEGYPILDNDPQVVKELTEVAKTILGESGVVIADKSRLLGEDFASYLDHAPGAFFFLGTRGDEATSYPLHSPYFDIDERALSIGVDLYKGLAKKYNGR